MTKNSFLAAGLLSALCLPARAVEYVPMVNLSLIGGQYFFAGDKSHLNANLMANVTPAVKFDNGWTVLPTYSGYFRGTKSVTDSVGAGTLFQQMMDHRGSLTGIYAVPDTDWKLKPNCSYKFEFMKESNDEEWGKGLFDYGKIGLGFEAEKVYRDPFSIRLAYDMYWIYFPHYNSLESKSGVDPSGDPLGRELAGTKVLNTFNKQFTVTASRPYPYDDPVVSLQGSYSFLWQIFKDQPLVDEAGRYLRRRREDYGQTVNLSVTYPRSFKGDSLRLNSSFQTGLIYIGSNQNTYDAGQTKYVPDAYSYTTVLWGPSLNLSWGDKKKPQSAGLSFLWSRTQYSGRLAQDGSGLYTADCQHQNRYLLSLGYGYPVADHFRLTANTNFLWATSNQQFQATYKYTYNAANYFLGFTYDY